MNETAKLATELVLGLTTLAAMCGLAYDAVIQDIGDERPLLWIALLASLTRIQLSKMK